jgi:uncharacterized membrane protein
MLKRVVVLGVVGVFLAVPSAIAKSSSHVKKATPAKPAMTANAPHAGQCPFQNESADL